MANAMVSARFHPAGWNDPPGGIQVDLVPPGAKHFASARCRQNHKFKRPCCRRVSGPKICHEGTNLGPRQSGMVLDAHDLAGLWQHVGDVTTPTCRIFA